MGYNIYIFQKTCHIPTNNLEKQLMLYLVHLMRMVAILWTGMNLEIFLMLLCNKWVLEDKSVKNRLMPYWKQLIQVVMVKLLRHNFTKSLLKLQINDDDRPYKN